MIHHSRYHQMINRGRKAGLNMRELNAALSATRVEGMEQVPGQTDGNGLVVGIDERGNRTYRPAVSAPDGAN